MTSMDAESVANILCTCKQTRFNIQSPNYRELDVEGLNITVTSGAGVGKTGKGKSSRPKGGEGTEILNNAKLRLKAGERYALLGRNGTGKSTLLKAIAEKLIPGIPEETRVVILQQTDIKSDEASDETLPDGTPSPKVSTGRNVLEEVIERATSKHEVEQEISILSSGVDSNSPYGGLKSFRKVRHQRLQREFFIKDKDARLRSGARGWNARKALIAMEKKVAEFEAECNQADEDISPEALAKETSEAADMLADLQLQVELSKLADVESRARKILAGLGFPDSYLEKPVSSLSGGWRMRTALAAALLQETDILILDEPTNFLDLLGIMWLQRHLELTAESSDAPTLILVSHDRDFISLCTDLIIIREKDLTYFHGDLPSYESSMADKKAHLTKMKEAQDKQKDHIQQTIQRNMREGKAKDDQNKMRQAKSRQKKLDDRWGLETSAKGGRFKLNRDLVGYHLSSRAEIDIPQDQKPIHFSFPEPPDLRFPGALLSLEKVSFRYPRTTTTTKTPAGAATSPLVLQDINLSVGMGDRVGILGLNGSGKSTLVRLLVEQARPTAGTLTSHPRLRLGYYSQHAVEELQRRGLAEPHMTALSLLLSSSEAAVSGAVGVGGGGDEQQGAVRALLARVGLPGRLASDVPVRRLSGGQLVRLELARLLRGSPQLLVLDEATTHLDYETVGALRRALRGWPGAVVLVTHDRWFMRGAVEGIVLEDDGDDADELEDDSEDGDGDFRAGGSSGAGGGVPRRRTVYRLRGGQLKVLQGGTQEFEDSLEKKVKKMVD